MALTSSTTCAAAECIQIRCQTSDANKPPRTPLHTLQRTSTPRTPLFSCTRRLGVIGHYGYCVASSGIFPPVPSRVIFVANFRTEQINPLLCAMSWHCSKRSELLLALSSISFTLDPPRSQVWDPHLSASIYHSTTSHTIAGNWTHNAEQTHFAELGPLK